MQTLLVTTEETPYERIPCNDYQSQPRHYEDVSHKVTVHALDCDSISQVKQKVIDAVFCGLPASQRPSHHCVALGENNVSSCHFGSRTTNKITERVLIKSLICLTSWRFIDRVADGGRPADAAGR